jgi:hypothetical protein
MMHTHLLLTMLLIHTTMSALLRSQFVLLLTHDAHTSVAHNAAHPYNNVCTAALTVCAASHP